jgi:hypothetical protein
MTLKKERGSKMGYFIQKETMSLSGSAVEDQFTLTRGTGQQIREVKISFANAVAGDYVQIFRKDTDSTANEQDDANAASLNVLFAEGYLDVNGSLTIPIYRATVQDFQLNTKKLSVLVSSTQTGTVYLNIAYEYS